MLRTPEQAAKGFRNLKLGKNRLFPAGLARDLHLLRDGCSGFHITFTHDGDSMFRTAFRLPFHLIGIPVHFDISFFIILPLLSWMIGSNIAVYVELFGLAIDPAPLQQGLMPWVLGLAAALGLFSSVVVHELGHSVVGMHYGMRIRRITLWILGGMAEFEEIPRRPRAETLMAAAGPLTSVAIAGIFWGLLRVLPEWIATGQFVFAYLMYMNLVLAIFNLLPALPLDGGRILRSLLATRMSRLEATEIAGSVSRMVAIALGVLGFLSLNVFLMLIAWFIFIAGTGETQMVAIADTLREVEVEDLMTRNVETVTPEMRLSRLIAKMLEERHLAYPVIDRFGRVAGIVTLEHIRLGRDMGVADPAVRDVMSSSVNEISPHATAWEAFQKMSSNDFDRLVVLDSNHHLIGIVTKTDLIRAIQIRAVTSA